MKLTSSTEDINIENLEITENSNSILIINNIDYETEINLFGLLGELIINEKINSGSIFEINKEK